MRIIAGKYKSRKIYSALSSKEETVKRKRRAHAGETDGLRDLRPTTDRARESLFNILNNIVDFEGLKCLELFAGTGAVGFELISRGAETVSFVESSDNQIKLIEKTASELGCISQIELHKQNAAAYLSDRKGGFYDLVFADPPYSFADNQKWLKALALVKFSVFIFERCGSNDPEFTFDGFNVMDRKTGITNFKIYISES